MSEAALPSQSSVSIRAEPSLIDRNLCKFTVSRQVHPGSFFFENRERATGSPLIEQLFQIPGVTSVLVAENVVTVGKKDDAAWRDLMLKIGQTIRTQMITGVPAILEHAPAAAAGRRSDEEIRQVVQGLLEREINPSVASHGGKISVVDVKEGVLYISMSGGCQGCAAAQVTLRQGVEVMVRRVVPEITAIVDSTDHRAGAQPYYRDQP